MYRSYQSVSLLALLKYYQSRLQLAHRKKVCPAVEVYFHFSRQGIRLQTQLFSCKTKHFDECYTAGECGNNELNAVAWFGYNTTVVCVSLV